MVSLRDTSIVFLDTSQWTWRRDPAVTDGKWRWPEGKSRHVRNFMYDVFLIAIFNWFWGISEKGKLGNKLRCVPGRSLVTTAGGQRGREKPPWGEQKISYVPATERRRNRRCHRQRSSAEHRTADCARNLKMKQRIIRFSGLPPWAWNQDFIQKAYNTIIPLIVDTLTASCGNKIYLLKWAN